MNFLVKQHEIRVGRIYGKMSNMPTGESETLKTHRAPTTTRDS